MALSTERILRLKLVSPPEAELKETVEAFRRACRKASARVQSDLLKFDSEAIQQATYRDLSPLPSNMRCNVARVVAGAYKSWRTNVGRGPPPSMGRSNVQYNIRHDWNYLGEYVSIRTLKRKVRLMYMVGPNDLTRLHEAVKINGLGGARLVHTRRGWFLDVHVKLSDVPSYLPLTPVGVDRGITYLAVARAPGERPLLIGGHRVVHERRRFLNQRSRLQAKGTRSAKRVLRRLSGNERRYFVNEARTAAKGITEYALHFNKPVLVLENLRGIQKRAPKKGRSGATQRFLLNTWGYLVLLKSIMARAEAVGIPVAFVSPAWTSQTCPRCEDVRDENRNGTSFQCRKCGYRNHADVVGATNLARRWLKEHAPQSWGSVNGPHECGRMEPPQQGTPDPTLKTANLGGGVDAPAPTLPPSR